jgi:predicted nuclease with TOPRIM domain
MLIVEPGRSVSLIKSASKRKRTRNELEEVKGEEKILKEDKQQFLMEFKRLREQNEELQNQVFELSQGD